MSTTIDDLLAAFCDELKQTSQRYAPFVNQAEEAGDPHVAKFFRAVIASETVRTRLVCNGMVNHAKETHDYFICPHCGLIFIPDAPDKCPVDDTPGDRFERIG